MLCLWKLIKALVRVTQLVVKKKDPVKDHVNDARHVRLTSKTPKEAEP